MGIIQENNPPQNKDGYFRDSIGLNYRMVGIVNAVKNANRMKKRQKISQKLMNLREEFVPLLDRIETFRENRTRWITLDIYTQNGD